MGAEPTVVSVAFDGSEPATGTSTWAGTALAVRFCVCVYCT